MRLYGLHRPCAPPLPGKGVLHHRHDPGDRPLPLGAGYRPGGSGRGAGLLRRRRGLRHGQPAAGAGRRVPGRQRGGRPRPDRRPQRRGGAGCAAGPRFLRHLAVGPPHAVGGHRKASGLRRSGRFRAGAVQSLVQGPPGLSAPGCGCPAGKRQSPGHPLRFCAEHRPGRAGKAHPTPQPAPGH